MRLTTRELDAIDEALAFRLAGDYDDGDVDPDALETAQRKIATELVRRARTLVGPRGFEPPRA